MEVLIDPAKVCLFIPAGLKNFKLNLFNRIGAKIEAAGGRIVRHDVSQLSRLPDDVIPIVGCQPESTSLIKQWRLSGRQWCYWDRGYYLRIFATHTPRGENGGMYRWHRNSFQLQELRDVPGDRWQNDLAKIRKAGGIWATMGTDGLPWQRNGRHIVVAKPTATYSRFHALDNWTERTIAELKKYTDRKIITRDKEDKRPLQEDLRGAHALVAHGSIAAVEAVICGCPVFVCADSAAALVGRTELAKIEEPVYPDRQAWLNSLAYSQFSETELTNNVLWKLIT